MIRIDNNAYINLFKRVMQKFKDIRKNIYYKVTYLTIVTVFYYLLYRINLNGGNDLYSKFWLINIVIILFVIGLRSVVFDLLFLMYLLIMISVTGSGGG